MRIKNKKTYWLKKKITTEDNEGNVYADYSEAIEIKANIYPASGKLQAEIYGERLNYIFNMLYDSQEKLNEGDGICVFVDKDKIPTLIFDEIDTGISGTIGKRVGEKMYEVSIKHQVLCITHLPQIAALSDNHYFVSKHVVDGKTFTGIRMLTREDKIREIAKMVGGDEISDVTIENASEMVKFAEIKKKEMKNI